MIPLLPENPELELLLAREPQNQETLAVYSDWLLSHDHPLGELIALNLRGLKKANQKENRERAQFLMAGFCAPLERGLWTKQDSLNRTRLFAISEEMDTQIALEWEHMFVRRASIKLFAGDPYETILERLNEILLSPVFLLLNELEIFVYPGTMRKTWKDAPDRIRMHTHAVKLFDDILRTCIDSEAGKYVMSLELMVFVRREMLKDVPLSPFLQAFPHLSELTLHDDMPPAELRTHDLSKLELGIYDTNLGWRNILSSSDFTNLKSLSLFTLASESEGDIDFLLNNNSFLNLRTLCLPFDVGSGIFCNSLMKLNLPRLTDLDLFIQNQTFSPNTWRKFLPFFHAPNLPALTSLGFEYPDHGRIFLEELAASALLSNLKKLHFRNGVIGDDDLKPLLKNPKPFMHLEEISMSRVFLSRDTLRLLRDNFKGKLNFNIPGESIAPPTLEVEICTDDLDTTR